MQAENKKRKKNKKRRRRWRNAECTATASKTFTNLPRFAAMCLILAWPTRVRNYSWVLLRWSNLRRLYPTPPPWLTIPSSSLSSCFLLSACLLCCYFRYKLSAHIFAVLPIFNYTSCNMYRSPRTPSISTPVSVASSNWRPALCHAPHCRLICRACCCCCCTCHSLSLLHLHLHIQSYIYSISNFIVYSFLFQSESGHTLKATQP